MSTETALQNIKIDTEIDCMFELSGILLARGSQILFTKIIRKLEPKPIRKSTFVNLDRICCSIQEASNYTPSDSMTWKSIRSEFYWKCIHNTFRVGDFWLHVEALSIRAEFQTCRVTDTFEHIALECTTPGQSLVWSLTQQLWLKKYQQWPTLNWGLVLGCNLVTFQSDKGRLFAILVSIAWHLIWNLRRERIHKHWLKSVNTVLTRDRLLTVKNKFGSLAFKKPMVLNTWSGILGEEESLPEDWGFSGYVTHD
ncbi:hypothetical protein C8R45DRAFT_1053084 [Mycena sanguinolenta]|nr:hypothetical protein C8R45DRAFT_1053084 [Mycena sanguinolenta]